MFGLGRKTLFVKNKVILIGLTFCLAIILSFNAYALNLAPDCSQASATPELIIGDDNLMLPIQIGGIIDPEAQAIVIETQCILQNEPIEYWRWPNTDIYGQNYSGDDDDNAHENEHEHEYNQLGPYDGDGLSTATPTVRNRVREEYYSLTQLKEIETEIRIYDIVFKATDLEGAMCAGKVSLKVVEELEDLTEEPFVDHLERFPSLPGGVNCAAIPINNPPIIYSEAVSEGKQDELYQYTVLGHDPDSEPLVYSVVNQIPGLSINAETGLIDWIPSADQVGVHAISVAATDAGGLQAIQRFEVNITPAADILTAEIIANPTSGTSPLTVRFTSVVQNHNIVINSYAWDFTSDGTTDVSDTFGSPRTYTYSGVPGQSFVATLTVTPASGDPLVATKTITIDNQAPTVSVASSTTNGHAPLAITFTVSAQDPQGITELSIDYDNDGVFDEIQAGNNLTSGTWTFQTSYANEGSFVASVKVTDAYGAATMLSNNAITVDVNNPLDPIISLSTNVSSGNTPLTTTLSASATIFDASTITQWRWDLDGNGDFETVGGTALNDSVSQTYTAVDNYYPVVEVLTDSGRTARASLRIQTTSTAKPTLNIPNSSDTINRDAAQQANFSVSLPYDTVLEVWMENSSGERIKTVYPAQASIAGIHDFVWDASNDLNDSVAEADYYVVIGYEQYGTQKMIDLRDTTGGQLSYYRRTTSNPRRFNRLKQPLRIDYAVDDPAEVSFFWQVSFGARLMTLMERERLGRGPYTLYWNGEYPSGAKVATNLNLMPGIVRYSLPDNVIFVKENPRIENYTLKSTIIVDPRREPIELNLVLSKASTIEMVVSDMGKGVDVATRAFANVNPGAQTLVWDGKNNFDQYLAPGDYRIGIRSVDNVGKRSLFWYRTQRIDY